jgi:predicted transcriptional regulator
MRRWKVKTVFKKSPIAVAIYEVICRNANSDGLCCMDRKTLAKSVGIKRIATVSNAVKLLNKAGWIRRRYKLEGRKSFYRLWVPKQNLDQAAHSSATPDCDRSGVAPQRTQKIDQVAHSSATPSSFRRRGAVPADPPPSIEGDSPPGPPQDIHPAALKEKRRMEEIRAARLLRSSATAIESETENVEN